MTKPLATVEGSGTAIAIEGTPGALGVERAEWLAASINAAHEKAVAPLLALLAEAYLNLVALHERLKNHVNCDGKCPTIALLKAIDADPPPEFVPKQKYDELQRVLADLQEERRDVWRERCERARSALRSSKTMNAAGIFFNQRGADSALAILEEHLPDSA